MRILENFPVNSFPKTCFPAILSPDLTKYVDLNCMYIFDTTTGEKLAKIERHYIQDFGQLNANLTANTIKWHNSN